MATRNPSWGTYIDRSGKIAASLLAMYGLFDLGQRLTVTVAGWLGVGTLSAVVRPICESQMLHVEGEKYPDVVGLKMIGVEILTEKPLSHARVRISGIKRAVGWGVTNDGMSESERSDFYRQLEFGEITGKVVTPELPPLSEGSSTSLVMAALTTPEFNCMTRDWFEVTSPGAKIFHIDPSFFLVREMPRISLEGHWLWIVPSVLVGGVTILALIWRRYLRWKIIRV